MAGVVILLFWAGLKAWRIYQAGSSLMARQAEAERLLANGLGSVDAGAAEDLVFGVRADVVDLDNEVGFIMPLLPYFGWLPKIGPLATAAPHLLEMADAGTEAAAYAFRGVKPALELQQKDSDAGSIAR